jgi:uncharacterized membrane protein
MFGQSRTAALKDKAMSATELGSALAKDKKFRKELVSAISHGTLARRRAARKLGFVAAATRLAGDPKLKHDLNKMMSSLDKVLHRVEKKQSHKLRNTLLVLGGVGGVVAAAIPLRKKLPSLGGTTPRTIDASTEVNVPVSTAYNQWTQFEDFPLFMEGVEHVEQKDDTRLHWVAKVGGKTNEWDAKILEQHPDKQVSWISEDGKKTRGTVTFEPIGESRTRITLSMSYQAEGLTETLGSAVGLDQRRVRGDLERFKELIESRGAESGAWRGEVSAGTTKTK